MLQTVELRDNYAEMYNCFQDSLMSRIFKKEHHLFEIFCNNVKIVTSE